MINLYNEFHALTDTSLFDAEKKEKIYTLTSINDDIPLMFLGFLSNITNNEPQYYFNREVSTEVCNNLTYFYHQKPELFLHTLILNQGAFFDAINSYFHILDLYRELDSVAFENELKIKLYYLPIIQQTMEFCLNSFYTGINQIVNKFVESDFSKANKLGQYKNNLTAKSLNEYTFDKLTKINIDFRNAISHGKVDFLVDKIIYSYLENGSRNTLYKELKNSELENMKNELLDIAGGAIVGWVEFIVNNSLLEFIYHDELSEELKFEYFKLFFQNDNIRISSFSNNIIGSPQLNIQIKIENINDTNSIIHLIIVLLKAMYHFFPDYDRYFVSYKHPFSISGMISLNRDVIQEILTVTDIVQIDKTITNGEGLFLVHEIQKYDPNFKAYKFQVFPKIQSTKWEVTAINDISIDDLKRYKCNLIIDDSSITKDELISILFSVSKQVRELENQKNPYTKIKYGKVEADIVMLNVFYRQHERKPFALLSSNEYFICSTYYYKSNSTPRISVTFQNNYIYENIKKFDIYWNKHWSGINRSLL